MHSDGSANNVKVVLLASALAAGLYGLCQTRSFVAEDFVIVRLLVQRGWGFIWEQYSGPYLGLPDLRFYRPVAVTLLYLEIALVGLRPWALGLFHLVFHFLNVALVFRIFGKLCDSRTAAIGAAFFSLYPLHPNVVSWISASCALYGSSFFLASVSCQLEKRTKLSLLLFVLGLGCYESVAVLPVLLAGLNLVESDWKTSLHRARFHFLLLGLYFLWRKHCIGAFLGGYSELTPWRLRDFMVGLLKLPLPLSLRYPGMSVSTVLLCLGVVLLWKGVREKRLVGVCALWIILGLAPFRFPIAVPATGRYYYLAAAGVALAWALMVRKNPKGGLVVGLLWAVLLGQNTWACRRAGQEVERVQALVYDLSPPAPILLANYPKFLFQGRTVRMARVYLWGLYDAQREPFVNSSFQVYPLPELSVKQLNDLAQVSPYKIYRYDVSGLRLVGGGAVETTWENQSENEFISPNLPPGKTWVVGPAASTLVEGGKLPERFIELNLKLYTNVRILYWTEGGTEMREVRFFQD